MVASLLLARAVLAEPDGTRVADPRKAVADMRAPVNAGDMFMLREEESVKVPGLRYIHHGAAAGQTANASLRWDRKGLQVIMDCADNGIVAEQRGRDNIKLWKDDSVYIWLDPGHTHSNQVMLQLSAGGVLLDARDGDPSFDVEGASTEVIRTDNTWRAVVHVPWQGLGVSCPRPGDVWGMNLTRIDQPGKHDYSRAEYTSLAIIPSGDISEINRWGHILFAGKEAKPGDKESMAAGQALARAHAAVATVPARTVGLPIVAPTDVPQWQWRGLHLVASTWTGGQGSLALKKDIPALAKMGINLLILQVDYSFEYESHPELRARGSLLTKQRARELADLCRAKGIWLIPQFQCLGHQDGSPLLAKYPEFALIPGAVPTVAGNNFREWDPLNPRLNEIVFQLMDELLDAFQADALHVGMDEVFRLGHERSPSTRGKDPAKLFAQAVNDYYDHLVRKRNVQMLMWGDRLIDAGKMDYGAYESSNVGTAPAVDMIPRDIIICDWHYELRSSYPSVPMFIQKGFRVLPCSWNRNTATGALLGYSMRQKSPLMLGHLFTTWGKAPDPPRYAPMVEGLRLLKMEEANCRIKNPSPSPAKEVVEANGVVGWIQTGKAGVALQGQVEVAGRQGAGLSNAKDLKAQQEQGVKSFRGTVFFDNVAFEVAQRITEERDGVLRIDLEVSADGPIPSATGGDDLRGVIYSMQVPSPAFAGGIFEAGDVAGPLPDEKLPLCEIKLFRGRVERACFTTPDGLNLRLQLEPAAEITIQDSRQWSPNFSVPVALHPGTLPKGQKIKQTIRLGLDRNP